MTVEGAIKPASEFIAEAQESISCLDAVSAKVLYDEAEGALIIDVREAEGAKKDFLSGSINIPRGLIEMRLPSLCQTVDTLILVHCAGGGRASLVTARLNEMGYKNSHAITENFSNIKAVFDPTL